MTDQQTMTEINLSPELDNHEPKERRRLIAYCAAMRELQRRGVQIPLDTSMRLHFADATALQRIIDIVDNRAVMLAHFGGGSK